MPENKQVKINRILEGRCSTWLSIIPTHYNFFAMSSDEFKDALDYDISLLLRTSQVLVTVVVQASIYAML